MKLYTVPLAPNPVKVTLYLAERAEMGTVLDVEQIPINTLKGKHKEPEHIARNPFGTLPVLELDDGTFLIESLAIIEFFEDCFPVNAMRSGDHQANAMARNIERIADLKIGYPMGVFVHAAKSPVGYPADPEKASAMVAQMQKPFDYFEELLSDGRPLLCGDRISVADCTLAAFLQFMRFVDEDLLGERPLLRDWDNRYRARPAAKAVMRY